MDRSLQTPSDDHSHIEFRTSGNQRLEPTKDRGYSWVILACCTTLMFLVSLSMGSFGIYIVEFRNIYSENKRIFSMMYGINMAVFGMTGIISAALIEMTSPRVVAILGVLATATGYTTCSFSPNLHVLLVAYGFVVGFGMNLMDMAAHVSAQQYFDKRRGLANSIMISGFSLTVFVAPPLVNFLIEEYSWRGSFLIQSGIALHGLPVALLLRPFPGSVPSCGNGQITEERVRKKTQSHCRRFVRHLFVCQVLKNIAFLLIEIGSLCFFVTENISYLFTVARAVQLGIQRGKAAFIMSAWAVGNIIGELSLGWIGDRVQRARLLALTMGGSGAVLLISATCNTFPLQMAFGAVYGILLGGYYAVKVPTLVDMVGVDNLPSAQAVNLFFFGIAGITSPLLADFIAEESGDFNGSFYYAGVSGILAGGFVFSAILYERRAQRINKGHTGSFQETVYMQVKPVSDVSENHDSTPDTV